MCTWVAEMSRDSDSRLLASVGRAEAASATALQRAFLAVRFLSQARLRGLWKLPQQPDSLRLIFCQWFRELTIQEEVSVLVCFLRAPESGLPLRGAPLVPVVLSQPVRTRVRGRQETSSPSLTFWLGHAGGQGSPTGLAPGNQGRRGGGGGTLEAGSLDGNTQRPPECESQHPTAHPFA